MRGVNIMRSEMNKILMKIVKKIKVMMRYKFDLGLNLFWKLVRSDQILNHINIWHIIQKYLTSGLKKIHILLLQLTSLI